MMFSIFNKLKTRLATQRKMWQRANELAPHLEDLSSAMAEREGKGALTNQERELLENAMAFGALRADDVAVPRADIIAVPQGAPLKSILSMFAESQHSRLPVMGKGLDDLKGFVLLKDIIEHLETPASFSLPTLLRPLAVVPESMPLPRVLQHMKRAKVPLVLVTDEFGGTSGLISLKDILEQLVGDIVDESTEGAEAIVSMGAGRYRVRGDTALADIDRLLGTQLTALGDEDATTIAGLVLVVAQHIPVNAEVVQLAPNMVAEVLECDGRRILSVALAVPREGHA